MECFEKPFPIFDMGNFLLREITLKDVDNYFYYMNDPHVAAFLSVGLCPSSIEESTKELEYWSGLFRYGRGFYWGIALCDTGQLIGTIGFNYISFTNKRAEISYDLDYGYWGKGIMTRAMKKILQFAEQELGIVRLQALVVKTNIRSIKLLERCKFQYEGKLRKYEVLHGKNEDSLMYAILFC